MNIKIKTATANDSEEISEVFKITWLATYPNRKAGITKSDVRDVFQQSTLKKSSGTGRILVAKSSGRVVGVCKTSLNAIRALYVLPSHQWKGIGTALLNRALKRFGNKTISVNVASYNKKAIEFYTKHGFVASGRSVHSKAAVLPSGKLIPEMEMVRKKRS